MADRLIRDVEAKEAASVMDQTRAGGERGKGEGSGKLPAWVIIREWPSERNTGAAPLFVCRCGGLEMR